MSNYDKFSGMTLKDLLKNPGLKHVSATSCGDPREKVKKTTSETAESDFTSAFLGPQLWDKAHNSNHLNFEYMDLDEFLSENLNDAPVTESESWEKLMSASPLQHPPVPQGIVSPHRSLSPCIRPGLSLTPNPHLSPSPHIGFGLYASPPHSPPSSSCAALNRRGGAAVVPPVRAGGSCSSMAKAKTDAAENAFQRTGSTGSASPGALSSGSNGSTPPISPHPVQVDFRLSEQDLVLSSIPGQSIFDPTSHMFSEEELKPQPMIKKSKKIFVPEDLKDDRYWVKRKKNNMAAKRSRDARRVKENQIAMRAAYLEKENITIQDEIDRIRRENACLKHSLNKYELAA